ncbi:MAG: 3-oxoacyl-ACP reductase [Nostocoides sp.]
MASDLYGDFVRTGLGKKVVGSLGLPHPVRLRRYSPSAPLIEGTVVVAGHGDAPLAAHIASMLTSLHLEVVHEAPATGSVGAVIADLSSIEHPEDLESLRAIVAPTLKSLGASARVVIIGRPPEAATSPAQRAARRALEGITRSIGKELRRGGTANLVLVGEGDDANVDATIRYLLSGRSAYVSGQVVTVGAGSPTEPGDWARPLAGKVAVVTGAARGIGAAIAEVLARDGATVVAVDIPAAGDALAKVANAIGGTALQLDVTVADAGQRIVDHANSRHGGLDIVVHNAGITRDKLLANTDEARWRSVLDVNLMAILRMNEAILATGGLRDGGHMVLVASIAGIAGNRGQSNYAASKAGIVGLTQALGSDPTLRKRGISVNAVAPGFIETEMTAKIPLGTREVGRRLNSLQQGGLPVDVAETIAWFSQDANAGVTGNVVRVCGQSLLGA